jgi:hypothetical protein
MSHHPSIGIPRWRLSGAGGTRHAAATERAPRSARRAAVPVVAPLATLALLALAAALLTAGGARTARSTSTVTLRTVSEANGYPAVGGTSLSIEDWPGGLVDGTLVDRTTVTGHPTPQTFTFSGTEVGVWARGTLRSTFTGSATRGSDGRLTIVRHGNFAGGTGAYGAATGHYTLRASARAGSPVMRGRLTTTVRY